MAVVHCRVEFVDRLVLVSTLPMLIFAYRLGQPNPAKKCKQTTNIVAPNVNVAPHVICVKFLRLTS